MAGRPLYNLKHKKDKLPTRSRYKQRKCIYFTTIDIDQNIYVCFLWVLELTKREVPEYYFQGLTLVKVCCVFSSGHLNNERKRNLPFLETSGDICLWFRYGFEGKMGQAFLRREDATGTNLKWRMSLLSFCVYRDENWVKPWGKGKRVKEGI